MKIVFIGLGNMARAVIGGMLRKDIVKPEDIIGTAKTRETREKTAAEFGIQTMEKMRMRRPGRMFLCSR